MPNLAVWLEAEHGITADPSNLSKLLCKAGFTYKKTLLASEKECSDVKAARRTWSVKVISFQIDRASLCDLNGLTISVNSQNEMTCANPSCVASQRGQHNGNRRYFSLDDTERAV